MATYRVDSTATGADNGTSWTDAFPTLQGGLTAASSLGDIVLVDDGHNESPSADTNLAVNAAHTKEQPLQIVVVDKADDTPVSDYGASGNGEIDVTAGHYHIAFTGGAVKVWGMRFIAEDSVSAPQFTSHIRFERCYYALVPSSSEDLQPDAGIYVEFIDCDIDFGTTYVVPFTFGSGDDGSQLFISGGSYIGGPTGARLVRADVDSNGKVLIVGCDLTGFNTSGAFVEVSGVLESLTVDFINNILPATEPALFAGAKTNLTPGSYIKMVGDEPYRFSQVLFNGTMVEETTIRRTSGASDGSTAYSLKIESDSSARESSPMRILLACQNYGDLSGKTLKVHFAQDSGAPTAIKDIDIWLEVSAAQASAQDWRTTRTLPLATGSDHTDESGSEDWRNGGGALSGYTEQSISASGFGTTQGMVYVWLCVARDFTTDNLYVCPKIEIA